MPSPPITPPSAWLCAMRGLMTRPTASELTTRRTRVSSTSGSTVTSTKCAPKLQKEYLSFSLPGPLVWWPSTEATFRRASSSA